MSHRTSVSAGRIGSLATSHLAIAVELLLATNGALYGSTAIAQTDAPSAATLSAVTVADHREAMDEAPPAAAGGQVAAGARMGILGNVSVMQTPFSVTSYTAQAIENEQARSVADVLSADPSVRMGTARSNIGEDLNIRGFAVPSSDFALNGMFGLTPYWRVPLEAVERVEVIKGPSAALFGMAPSGSVGGVVNLVPKRAGHDPITRITMGASSDSVLGAHVDIGRRFGVDDAFGARLNVAHREGDTALDGQSVRESLASLGLDFRQRQFRASVDLLWSKERINNIVRQFQLAPTLTSVPAAPNAKFTYPGMGWSDGRNGSATFKAEYDLSDAVTVYAGYGERKLHWGALAANPVLQNTAGDYTYFGGWQRMPVETRSLDAGLRGNFKTGGVTHSLSLGYTQLKQEQGLAFYTGFPGGASNLYTGQRFTTPSIAGLSNPVRPYVDTKLTSLALADTLGFMDDRLLVSLGLRHQTVAGQNYNFMTGAASGPYYDKSATTPFAGVVFKLQPAVSLYASYVEGLSRGDTAPVSATITNPGENLAPYRSKQKEIGAKFDLDGTMATVSLFELTKPSAGISGTTYGLFGEQRNRGIEATVSGEAARGLRVLGGVTYMDGVLSKAVDPALQGKDAIGVSKWQLNLGVDWDAPFAPGLALSGRMIHTGKAAVNETNTLYIPHWTRFDAGVRYATKLGGERVTFRLNVENLANKNYWGTATAAYLFVGSPRTVSLSVGVDL